MNTDSFALMAVEALGVWGAEAEELLGELGRQLAESSQYTRTKYFLRQLIDVAVKEAMLFQSWALS